MAITVKQFIEGIFLEEIKIALSQVQDPIDFLNSKVVYSDTETIVRKTAVDVSTIARVDQYGDVVGTAHKASYVDRTYPSDTYTIPFSNIIQFSIPFDRLYEFGLTKEMLSQNEDSLSATSLAKFSEKAREEFSKLIRKILRNRKTEMITALKELEAGTHDARKPLGCEIVDVVATRGTYWPYTNQLSTVLTEDSYKIAVDMFASSQKTVDGESYGISRPVILLHASSYTLAESIHLPDISVNELQRTAGGSIEMKAGSVKSVGVYGDSDNQDDWICLGADHQIYRKAMRDPFNGETNGIVARFYVSEDNGEVVFEVRDRSVVVIDSPIDILKSVAP
jgi:hypothetical protein